MKRRFQFHSTRFNITEPREYFINEACYGDDLAEWLISELGRSGIRTTSNPQQEDFGWFFTFVVDDIDHSVVVGFQPNDLETGDSWIGWIERNVGFLDRLIGGRDRDILPKAVEIIDSILSSTAEVRELRWTADDET